MSPLAQALALPVRAYRLLLSPWVGHGCRFQPTCSAYALEALETHGAVRGLRLAALRIVRCHPWGGSGIDHVPGRDPPGILEVDYDLADTGAGEKGIGADGQVARRAAQSSRRNPP